MSSFWNTVIRYWQPIADRINVWTAPIRSFFSPVGEFFAPFLAPFQAAWMRFKLRFPVMGKIIGFGATAAKYLTIFIFSLILLTRIGLFGRMPSNKELRNVQTQNAAEIYSQDSVLLGRYYIINRTTTTLGDISDHVVNALIATEDVRYYHHNGIDYQAYLRVIGRTFLLQDESSGGGSTITQQLAKNLYPRKPYWFFGTLINKIQEAFIALKLERVYDKKQIVNLYLNTVPFSNNVYGIDVAAKRFFNKIPKDLTIDESAILIGMLKSNDSIRPKAEP